MFAKLVPWLLGGAAVLSFAGAASASTPKTAPPSPLPVPVPPQPPIPPAPNPAQAVLLAQLQILMQQAATTPGLVDPQQLETLAYQLDAAGLPQQAAQARDLALRIRLSRGTQPTPPSPAPTPDVLLAQYTALLSQAMTDPTHTDPVMLDQLAIQLDAAGMGYQAQVLRAASADVKKKRSQIPPLK